MSYNLILNSEFKNNNNWKFINCSYIDGKLISTDKVFGIEQELVLPDPTKLYFRINYQSLSTGLYDVMVGIQNNDILNIDRKVPKYNKEQKISVIDIAKQEKIKVQIIFQSLDEVNEVVIKNPILLDLNHAGKSKWLKIILDRTVEYVPGYSYINESEISEITPESFEDLQLSKAKIGSIISTKEKKIIDINAKFIDKTYYLVKLDLSEINELGSIYFQYGMMKSTNIKDQCYIVFKANEVNKLQLIIEPNSELDYKINLKHLLITNISKMRLLREDIPYIPFIGDNNENTI